MKKLKLATVIAVISISLMGCSELEQLNNQNKEPINNQVNSGDNNTADNTNNNSNNNIADNTADNQNNNVEDNTADNSNNNTADNTADNSNSNTVDNTADNSNSNINNNSINNKSNNQSNNQSNLNSAVNISVEEAKEIALRHLGVTSNQVAFKKVEMDFDHGIQMYDVEFYYNNREYDYEVNASNGDILSYNNEGNNQSNNQGNLNSAVNISVEEAKEIALKHLGVTSNQVAFKKVEVDFDDGIQMYDVEFYYNNREYSYEINASNGDILSYDQD